MTEKPDFTALARQYLDLWEDQLSAMAGDSALAEQTARFFETMGQAAPAANPMATAQMAAMAQQFMNLAGLATQGTANDDRKNDGFAKPAAAGSASAATASDNSDEQLAELASRLAALEERLDRLEAGGGGPRGSTKPPAKKRGAAGKKSKSRAKPKKV